MTDITDIKTDAEVLQQMRDLIAAITREAGRRGADEIVDLAGRVDDLAAGLQSRIAHHL